jgi:hypothetical protein
MNKFSIYLFVSILSAVIFSCSKTETPSESIATDSTFANYTSWKLEATTKGPSPSLGTAHAGNDSTVTRKTYFFNGQSRVDGSYPIGTVIVKHATNSTGTFTEIVGMVKRGNNFNPSVGNWEWFMLNANGTIAKDASGNSIRGGATLMGGMCNNCHVKATSTKDFTFTK